MKALEAFDRIVNGIRRFVLAAILIAVIALCTTNIVLRYLIKGVATLRPFPWVDELMRMGIIWVAFLAAGLGDAPVPQLSAEHPDFERLVLRGRPRRLRLSVL